MQKNINSTNKVVSFEGVWKQYNSSEEPSLQDVSFSVTEGEFLCLIGPSGCGKSTVLKIIAGLEKETDGVVQAPENVSMVFQSGALFPWFTVRENIELGMQMLKMSSRRIKEDGIKYAEMMGLSPYLNKHPRELSGGQRQRVGIARALAVEPAVLLLDEPFAALDPKTTYELHNDILKIWEDTGKTIVMVSHLIEEAVSLAQKIILMKNFSIVETFDISIPRPRREQMRDYHETVDKIRREFFK